VTSAKQSFQMWKKKDYGYNVFNVFWITC